MTTDKYITFNRYVNHFTSPSPDLEINKEIAKITNAAQSAGIAVYNECKPSQETIDNEIEVEWIEVYCGSMGIWDESQWSEWFHQQ